jgi:hypothetical protein
MSSNVASASRRQALRLRTCLAAAVGLPSLGCPSSGDEEAARPVVVPRDDDVVTTADGKPSDEGRTTKSAASRIMSIVNDAKADGDADDETGEAAAGSSRPGWKNAEGLYCQAEIDSRASGTAAAECGTETRTLFEIPDQPGGMHGFSLDDEGTTRERAKIADACCYHVIRPPRGRPLRLADDARSPAVAPIVERKDWAAQLLASDDPALAGPWLDPDGRRRAAAAWAEDAALEHASVAEFSRIALVLLARGAPPALVAAAQRAALDEVEHAGIAFGIASALGGRVVGPGSLDLSSMHVAPSLTSLVRETITDGCVGEGLASLELAVAADAVQSPAMAAAMRKMAADERRHAELGYAIVLWAIEIADEDERDVIADALVETIAALKRVLETRDDDASATEAPAGLGRLGAADGRRVRRDGLMLAIIPALEALSCIARPRPRIASAD